MDAFIDALLRLVSPSTTAIARSIITISSAKPCRDLLCFRTLMSSVLYPGFST
jgi:hypothetical protein